MTLNTFLHFGGALFCVGLACFALFRDPRSFVHRVFAVGMVLFALESLFTGLSVQALFPEEVIRWQRWRLLVAALLPGSWLIFSLSFTQGEDKPTLGGLKWVVLGIFCVHLAFVTIFLPDFFRDDPVFNPSHGWLLRLGWSGHVFYICFLLSIVFIMMLLERALRSSRGLKRWKVKFLALGIGAIFAARVYTGSQALLFRTVNLELQAINGAALLVAGLLILTFIFRAGVLHMDIYLSHTMLYNSLTALMVGVYLLAVGGLAKVMSYVDEGSSLPLRAFVVFLALLGLLMVLLSDTVRQRMKRFISLHFNSPKYDYRKAWMDFTQRTAALVEVKGLCDAVVKMVSELFDSRAVSIWVLDETQEGFKLGGSTVFSKGQARGISGHRKGAKHLIRLMGDQKTILDLDGQEASWVEELKRACPNFFQEARIRYCVPLVAGADLLGLITLDDRLGGVPLSVEELDLLKTIADQAAGSLLSLKLSERLRQTREMEAFQTLAAFFVHDLKNLASKLSMMLQNLPVHFEDPAFRDDALRLMSQSLTKINGMCSRLSLLREGLELRPIQADLNEVVSTTLAGLDGVFKASIVEDLHPIPKVSLDPEQVRKVLTNLVFNAKEAMGDGGKIRVTTGKRDGWVELTVSDKGCGMSQEFMEQCLFRPFKTTKKQGTGIGLFQSKMIVDAHNGEIEVESQVGKGSTFRVFLPISSR